MTVRLRALAEAIRNSLFFVPLLCVLCALGLAQVMLAVDRRVDLETVPSVLRFTVESARELLATVAGAIITVAAIVFAFGRRCPRCDLLIRTGPWRGPPDHKTP